MYALTQRRGVLFALPGAVVYSRELLEKRVWMAQPSAGFALLTMQGLQRAQMSRTRE